MPINMQWNPNLLRMAIWNALQPSSGWIEWTPSLGPAIYVSDSVGSDANDGLTELTPKQTLAGGRAVLTSGSHMLLKCGDEWSDQFLCYHNTTLPNGTAANNTVIGYYGDESLGRPKVSRGGGANYIIYHTFENPASYITYDGIEFNNYKFDYNDIPRYDPSEGNTMALLYLKGGHSNIVFQDCYTPFCGFNIQDQSGARPNNFTFNRVISPNVYELTTTTGNDLERPSSYYIQGSDNFTFNDCVTDMGGWSDVVATAGANSYNHNFYLTDTCSDTFVFNRCLNTRASSHGIHGRAGGIFDNNFYGRCSVSQGFGYGTGTNPELQPGERAYLLNSVVSELASQYKEADYPNGFPRSTAMWGVICGGNDYIPGADVKVENSIVTMLDAVTYQHILDINGFPGIIGIDLNGAGPVTDSIVYHVNSPTEGDGAGYSDPDRTLGSYWDSLVLSGDVATAEANNFSKISAPSTLDSFADFVDFVKERDLRKWDDNFSVGAINNYFRVGFDKPTINF
jgi:hypothetical protein